MVNFPKLHLDLLMNPNFNRPEVIRAIKDVLLFSILIDRLYIHLINYIKFINQNFLLMNPN